MMPGTDGWELARRVRERYGAQLPMIALSATVGTLHRDRLEGSDFSAFLAKPALEMERLSALQRLLRP